MRVDAEQVYANWSTGLVRIVLLTGVTGALGSALLPLLAQQFPDHDIYCLIRATDAAAARGRLDAVIGGAAMAGDASRIHALQGDAALPGFGLADGVLDDLAARVEKIFHLAASVDFDLPLPESRAINVHSTAAVLAFARRCRLRGTAGFHISYVSTAYVAGDRNGLLKESDLRLGQGFWNGYEESKLEAEELVAAAAHELPVTVFRPSQVIGDSRTGAISKFFGFYEFVGLAVRGRSNILVADPDARPDMVPLDYVCRALLHLSARPDAAGATYHLAAGLANSLAVSEVVEAVLEVMARHKAGSEATARPRIIRADRLALDAAPDELARYEYSAQKLLLRTYGPYLAYERDFDVAATHALLAQAGIVIPPMREAIMVTADYALRSRVRRREAPHNKPSQLGETA
ncbi:NAD-dependent epimerase/dehydratase family protein [Duganella sp. FT92W]|uniref:NAD-dependent epimerase/dehydratase family protein n=1 Tax=Pseudoduganella rivuli TaxID=2666085 RepID=A0A7X2LUJ2_9BURK|nr:NAD-dependent epimerase/dehydratase family protein [Pseudoduganella rivuli]